MRTFKLWKAQMMNFLIQQHKEDPEFQSQLRGLIDKLDFLRSDWISGFLSSLFRFSQRWGIKIPKELLPTQEELKKWIE